MAENPFVRSYIFFITAKIIVKPFQDFFLVFLQFLNSAVISPKSFKNYTVNSGKFAEIFLRLWHIFSVFSSQFLQIFLKVTRNFNRISSKTFLKNFSNYFLYFSLHTFISLKYVLALLKIFPFSKMFF